MSLRELGWVVFLAGLPFAHLLNRSLDIWHGHDLWVKGWVVILFASALGAQQTVRNWKANRPLACFVIWVGISTLYVWTVVMTKQKIYPINMLPSVFHLLIILLFYVSALMTWTTQSLSRLLRIMAWVGVVILLYCGLQLLSMDQFFHDLDTGISKDQLVGTIGNPTHLAIHLALLLNLFLLQPGWFWRGCALVSLVLILVTKSLGGQLAAFAVICWWVWHRRRTCFLPLVIGCGVVGGLYGLSHPSMFNPNGRWAAWAEFFEVFMEKPITGAGLGFVMELSRHVEEGSIFQWRHVHNEYFQVALECGVIGLGLLLWMLWETGKAVWTAQKTPLVITLTGLLLAFGVNSLVNFPAHLWLLGSYALVAYCGLRVIEAESCPS